MEHETTFNIILVFELNIFSKAKASKNKKNNKQFMLYDDKNVWLMMER